MSRRLILALMVAAALALPVTAVAVPGGGGPHGGPGGGPHGGPGGAGSAGGPGGGGKPGGAGGGGGKKPKALVLKGAYAPDEAGPAIEVVKANRKGYAGETISLDVSAAKIAVADVNGDGAATIDDVAAGDKLVVKGRPPKPEEGIEPVAVKMIVDQTNPPPEEEEPAI